MPAWLGWIAVVLLSLYLAIYPMLAAGIAWRSGGRCGRAGPRTCRCLGDHRMAPRQHLHRLRLEPGGRDASPTRTCSMRPLHRYLRPLRCGRASRVDWSACSSIGNGAARARSSRWHSCSCTSCRGRSFVPARLPRSAIRVVQPDMASRTSGVRASRKSPTSALHSFPCSRAADGHACCSGPRPP